MSIIIKILLGLLIAGFGFLVSWKAEWFYQNFGAIAWAEEKLGGTRNFYKLFGIVIIFLGLLVMTGLWGGFLQGTVGRALVPQQ